MSALLAGGKGRSSRAPSSGAAVAMALWVVADAPAWAQELRDIRGPVAIPGEAFWLWVLLAAVIAAGMLALFRLLQSRKVRATSPAAWRPPWEIALEDLDALQKEGRSGAGELKRFYSRLSEIVRVYVERRFDIRAPEMTTEEFLQAASSSSVLQDAHKVSLRELLSASDLVKFARTVPAEGDVAEALRLARCFVEETRPAAPVEAPRPVR